MDHTARSNGIDADLLPRPGEVVCGKADAALKLVDGDFMAMVIASMKGKAPPAAQNVAYNDYIARSNQICKPGY